MTTVKLGPVRTIMAFVDNPAAAARSWSEALGAPMDEDLRLVDLGHVELVFHPGDDERNPKGGTVGNPKGGTVAYFEVKELDEAHDALLAAGCTPHRGPLTLPNGRRICQIRDPFGTVWGSTAPATRTARDDDLAAKEAGAALLSAPAPVRAGAQSSCAEMPSF